MQKATTAYQQLIGDTEEWDMPRIAKELAVGYQTVKVWRNAANALARRAGDDARALGANALPAPTRTYFSKPIWTAGVIRQWAMQTGRMSSEGVPQRAKPPGRPRRIAA